MTENQATVAALQRQVARMWSAYSTLLRHCPPYRVPPTNVRFMLALSMYVDGFKSLVQASSALQCLVGSQAIVYPRLPDDVAALAREPFEKSVRQDDQFECEVAAAAAHTGSVLRMFVAEDRRIFLTPHIENYLTVASIHLSQFEGATQAVIWWSQTALKGKA